MIILINSERAYLLADCIQMRKNAVSIIIFLQQDRPKSDAFVE